MTDIEDVRAQQRAEMERLEAELWMRSAADEEARERVAKECDERAAWLRRYLDALEETDTHPGFPAEKYADLFERAAALLRAPRGENDLRKAVTAYTDALDVYRQECRTRDIPLVEYDYPEWQRLAEPLMEAERALRAALAAHDTTRPDEAR